MQDRCTKCTKSAVGSQIVIRKLLFVAIAAVSVWVAPALYDDIRIKNQLTWDGLITNGIVVSTRRPTKCGRYSCASIVTIQYQVNGREYQIDVTDHTLFRKALTVGSSISINYLPQNPAIADTEIYSASVNRYGYGTVLTLFIGLCLSGFHVYLAKHPLKARTKSLPVKSASSEHATSTKFVSTTNSQQAVTNQAARAIRLFGWLSLLLWALAVALGYAAHVRKGVPTPASIWAEIIVAMLPTLIPAVSFSVSHALNAKRVWARNATIAWSMLVLLLVPLGTIFGLYVFWQLRKKSSIPNDPLLQPIDTRQ